MNQDTFLTLFKAGDGNAAWAAVENALAQAAASKDSELADTKKALADLQAKVDSGIATIHAIIDDPAKDSEAGIKDFLLSQTIDGQVAKAEADAKSAQDKLDALKALQSKS